MTAPTSKNSTRNRSICRSTISRPASVMQVRTTCAY
ncbi:Uncharacterised protein [Mycobacterium tuberculosis]|nr:Uncharacterised protein [Mycobacterium tuberculosis]